MPTDPYGLTPVPLAALAAQITQRLREHFPARKERDRQVLALAEETGELMGAYRRWTGQARRTGPFSDVAAELADVVITAYITAHVLDRVLPEPPDLAELIDDHTHPGGDEQVMHLFTITGRFVQAHLAGRTNATGPADEVATAHLADVVAAAYATATVHGIDLADAITTKTAVLFTRGWRTPRT
ncbi:hypothetical protein [Actinomadura macrotermitis]|uniref:Uncharacterized protein n=1 Tax=Actinomadura macrotermitis TaxID=2585200 RepID=A0A7K0C1F3_9ACTN|nr:hypothetical protein [Actinomadura macrotermitis]MQY07259.1 hypothetical protein [Actinomadura macrotermitis]